MPAGKRASMREGPLAALFRKTADDQEAEQPEKRHPARPVPHLRRDRPDHELLPEVDGRGGAREPVGAGDCAGCRLDINRGVIEACKPGRVEPSHTQSSSKPRRPRVA